MKGVVKNVIKRVSHFITEAIEETPTFKFHESTDAMLDGSLRQAASLDHVELAKALLPLVPVSDHDFLVRVFSSYGYFESTLYISSKVDPKIVEQIDREIKRWSSSADKYVEELQILGESYEAS